MGLCCLKMPSYAGVYDSGSLGDFKNTRDATSEPTLLSELVSSDVL